MKLRSGVQMVALAILVFLAELPCLAQFTYTTNAGNTLTITGYTGSDTVVVVPSLINVGGTNLLVTGIGAGAFTNANPHPQTVTITIPYSVTNIDYTAFFNLYYLTEINVDPDNPSYRSIDGVLFDNSTLIAFPENKSGNSGSYIIPSGVTGIGPYAFYLCTDLTNTVTIPNGVTKIGSGAFRYCFFLKGVTIPNGVTYIGDGAFSNCGLTGITFPNSVTNGIASSMFDSCGNLMSFTIGTNITTISDHAFIRCEKLLTIDIPDSVTNIGYQAFAGCTSMLTVTIGTGITQIADAAFESCYNLTGVYFKGNEPYGACCSMFLYTYATVYHVAGAGGWVGGFFGNAPTALWISPNLMLNNHAPNFGAGSNGFGFTVSGTSNAPVIVEASMFTTPGWLPIYAFTLTNGLVHFSDAQWTNYAARFYRIRSP